MIGALALILQAVPPPVPAPAAELVAPGVINTAADEYGPTLSPDGRTLVFTRRFDREGREALMISWWRGGAWTTPERLPFSERADKEPAFATNGRRLYFASTREYPGKPAPTGPQGASDLWVVDWSGRTWGAPTPLPQGVNTSVYESYPAVAASGTLYWAGYREGGAGGNDLWRARPAGEGFAEPENLTALNTEHTDADPFVAPDESYVIFSSDRPGGAGEGDLYVSWQAGGTWSPPVSLGPVVNTTEYEYTPWVSADGRWLWFSRGWGEIWRIETRHLEALRPPR